MQTLIETLRRDWPEHRWNHVPQLMAVSGGADSVALLRAACELSPNRDLLCVAHFNHGWRGSESDADEAFVRDLCQTMGLRLEVERAQVTRKTEESARKLRYQFLSRLASNLGIEYVLTGHTASDRVETLLHNLCRGTGLAGVCSPTLARKMRSGITLVRPLIGCFRSQVDQYLADLRQPFRSDASNTDQAYRRNFLRASVLPMLREVYGTHVDLRLLSFSQIAEETLQSQQQQADEYWRQAESLSQLSTVLIRIKPKSGAAIFLPSKELLPTNWTIVQIALAGQWRCRGWPQQSLSRRHWELIRRFWSTALGTMPATGENSQGKSPRPKVTLPGRIRMEYRKGWVLLDSTPQ